MRVIWRGRKGDMASNTGREEGVREAVHSKSQSDAIAARGAGLVVGWRVEAVVLWSSVQRVRASCFD